MARCLCGPDCESVWSLGVTGASTDQLVPSCNHVVRLNLSRPCAEPALTICFRPLLPRLDSSQHKFSFNFELRHSCFVALTFVFVASGMRFVLLERLHDSVLVLLSVVAVATLSLCCCPVLVLLSVANWCHNVVHSSM